MKLEKAIQRAKARDKIQSSADALAVRAYNRMFMCISDLLNGRLKLRAAFRIWLATMGKQSTVDLAKSRLRKSAIDGRMIVEREAAVAVVEKYALHFRYCYRLVEVLKM